MRPLVDPVHLRHLVLQPELKACHDSGKYVELLKPLNRLLALLRPREAKNMPLAEKVAAWLENVPWVQLEGGRWVSNCYSGHVSSSLSVSKNHDFFDKNPDQDLFEQQARQITRIITGNYLNNGETTARPVTTLDFDPHYSENGYLFDYHVDSC